MAVKHASALHSHPDPGKSFTNAEMLEKIYIPETIQLLKKLGRQKVESMMEEGMLFIVFGDRSKRLSRIR